MEIKDLKQAEEFLMESTEYGDIKKYIEEKTETWNYEEFDEIANLICKIKKLLKELYEEIFEEQDDIVVEAFQWIIFEKIHDNFLPCIKTKFAEEDLIFFKKCKTLCDMKVLAEQFGADENYTIPLSAAVVELSVIDSHKSPAGKMNCLCSTYDLVFAEIKTAMVAIISQNSEKDHEIPVIDNSDIMPVLMTVIIRSKLVYMFSNLFYIKSFYHKMEENRIVCEIFRAFETAIDKIAKLDIDNIRPISGKVIQDINSQEYIKITSPSEENIINKTLVDEANQRVLNLITKSTFENEPFY